MSQMERIPPHSDEAEKSVLGAALILALFAMLIIRGYHIAMHAPDRYGFLICAGITTMLALQVILNIAVCTALVPCTGISLPFFSYGGTALFLIMCEMGVELPFTPPERPIRLFGKKQSSVHRKE